MTRRRGTGRFSRSLVVVAGLSLVAGACGSDDESEAGDTTAPAAATTAAAEATTTAETAGGGGAAATSAADCSLSAPVVIANGLGDGHKSTNPNAVLDYSDAIALAMEEINGAGGICGQQLEMPVPVIDPATAGDAAATDLQAFIAASPDVIFGFNSSSALDAAAAGIGPAGIPLINFSSNPQARTGGTAANEWLWTIRVPNDVSADAGAKYAMEELGACNIGLIYFNLSFGLQASEVQKKTIADAGCTIHADEPHDFNADDLTTEVLAMDGADAVMAWGTPNNVVLEVSTFKDQGIDVPVVTAGSAGYDSFYGNFAEEDLANWHAVVDCNPLETDPEWSSAYETKYGYKPSYAAAQAYDATMMVKAAIESQGSAEPAAIQTALNTVEFEGICGPYKNSDAILSTNVTTVDFAGGVPHTLSVVEFAK